jgi:beta-xylosidase
MHIQVQIKLTFRITGIVDFVHHWEFEITIKHNFYETGSISVFRWGEGDTCLLRDPVE